MLGSRWTAVGVCSLGAHHWVQGRKDSSRPVRDELARSRPPLSDNWAMLFFQAWLRSSYLLHSCWAVVWPCRIPWPKGCASDWRNYQTHPRVHCTVVTRLTRRLPVRLTAKRYRQAVRQPSALDAGRCRSKVNSRLEEVHTPCSNDDPFVNRVTHHCHTTTGSGSGGDVALSACGLARERERERDRERGKKERGRHTENAASDCSRRVLPGAAAEVAISLGIQTERQRGREEKRTIETQ